jgi:Bacterial nucleoid DNA-binding protein
LNKAQFLDLMSRNGDMPRAQAEKALATVVHSISDALTVDKDLRLQGLGTFSVVMKEARKGRNPQTGEEIDIPACRVVRFRPAKTIKEAIHG